MDYTGYLDGDAFDGGSATDTMIDVANNCDATQKTNYIDGFSDGLVGAKVGDEVSSDVTFPENYQSSDLAGKKTTFKFKIKGIYKPVTMDTLTDDMVADAFTEQKITTKRIWLHMYGRYSKSRPQIPSLRQVSAQLKMICWINVK